MAAEQGAACGLESPHEAHWWFDGDHDPENHRCPGVPEPDAATMQARLESRKPWWAMGKIDPGEFAMLRADEAADVLWNLCSAHGELVEMVRALEAKREAHVEATIAAITEDVRNA